MNVYGVCHSEQEARDRAAEHYLHGLQVEFVPFVGQWQFANTLGLSGVIDGGEVVERHEWETPYTVLPRSAWSYDGQRITRSFAQVLSSERQSDGAWSSPRVNVQVSGNDHVEVRRVFEQALMSLCAAKLPVSPNKEGELAKALKRWEFEQGWSATDKCWFDNENS